MSALFAICLAALIVYGECGWDAKKQDPNCVSDCVVCGTLTCESWNLSPTYCPVLGNITSVSVVNQLSTVQCTSTTYNYYQNVLTVDNGCRAEFEVCYVECPYDMEELDCASHHSELEICKAYAPISSVEILEQYSVNECQPGVSYTFQDNKLKVGEGCRAKFLLCVDVAADAAK